ncbi:MAG: nucleoside triphosphate pyrophosphohydrolase [Deltaproteobacteria bacterium]|nr:nucleoside triphosphate pyrophosphohydrolase [Deltaproteobacteria bacterium]
MSQHDTVQGLEELFQLVGRLRGEDGCPWDKVQTPSTIKNYLLEEAFELAEAVEAGDREGIEEELGDLLFQVVFLTFLLQEQWSLSLAEALQGVKTKMIRRHPHIFGDVTVDSVAEVKRNWAKIKAQEKSGKNNGRILDRVPKNLPPLMRAHRLSERAAGVGFDWANAAQVVEKLDEEMAELKEAMSNNGSKQRIEDELGDVLFTLVNLARFHGLTAHNALLRTTLKFVYRFNRVEDELRRQGKEPKTAGMAEMDRLWDQVKREPVSIESD